MPENKVFLLPGEYHASRTHCEIATLLGSCVAVALWNRKTHHGAMNHYLLHQAPADCKDPGRYGDLSTKNLIWLMRKMDKDGDGLQARIYGGGAVVGHLAQTTNIGGNNIETARAVLKAARIPIIEEEVGGTNGRRIYFDTSTGKVIVKVIQKSAETERLEQKRKDIATRDTRVLVVDDSPLVRKILCQAIEAANGLELCGQAEDAYEARDMIASSDPDVISLDIIMPKLDGLKFLQKIMQYYPKPVVICSTIAKKKSDIANKAIEYGAAAVVDKDKLEIYKGMDVLQKEYIPKIKLAAGKAVRKMTF